MEILEAAPLIRQMLDGVEAEALRRFEAGHEIAGHVVAVGDKVAKFKVGDKVGVGCMVDR